jgi:fermentation-respiration switch protein FrsA (DUF1100 family)
MTVFIKVVISILVVMIVGLLGICLFFLKKLMHPITTLKRKCTEDALDYDGVDANGFYEKDKEWIKIKSYHGYALEGLYFPNGTSKKTMIIVHGITCSLWCSIKYVDLFYKRGFNVLVYDHRNHGKSGGKFTTYGIYESDDVMACIDYLYQRNGEESVIGLHGESMGAATVMLAAGKDQRVQFIIEDCGYTDSSTLFKYRMKHDTRLIGRPIVKGALLMARLGYKVNLYEASPISAMKDLKIPVLFIHGEKDDYVPTFMVKDLYEVKNGFKALHIFEDSVHAMSFKDHRNEYEAVVVQFMKAIEVI